MAEALEVWLQARDAGGSLSGAARWGVAALLGCAIAGVSALALRSEPAPRATPAEASIASPARPVPASPDPTLPPASPSKPSKPKLAPATAAVPSRGELALALGDAQAALPAAPSLSQARAFARLCWAVVFRAIDEDWAPPGRLSALVALSERQLEGPSASLVAGNAWLLRWWFERSAGGGLDSAVFDRARLALGPAAEAGGWEARATASVSQVLLACDPAAGPTRKRLTRRLALSNADEVAKLAPGGEPELVAELRRRAAE